MRTKLLASGDVFVEVDRLQQPRADNKEIDVLSKQVAVFPSTMHEHRRDIDETDDRD